MDSGFTEHSGCPVYEGEKKIVTQWIRYGVDNQNPWDSFNTCKFDASSAQKCNDMPWLLASRFKTNHLNCLPYSILCFPSSNYDSGGETFRRKGLWVMSDFSWPSKSIQNSFFWRIQLDSPKGVGASYFFSRGRNSWISFQNSPLISVVARQSINLTRS